MNNKNNLFDNKFIYNINKQNYILHYTLYIYTITHIIYTIYLFYKLKKKNY